MKTLIDRVNETKSSTTPGLAEWAKNGLTIALAQQGDQMIADLKAQLAEAIRERDQARENGGVMGRHGR